MNSELKRAYPKNNCPYCGVRAQYETLEGNPGRFCGCPKCGAGPEKEEVWESRKIENQLRDEIRKLKAELKSSGKPPKKKLIKRNPKDKLPLDESPKTSEELTSALRILLGKK